MKRRTLALGASILILAAAGGLRAADSPEKAAETAASAWLATVDSGQYGESWDGAAALFKAAVSRGQWVAALDQVRKPLGKLVSRKLIVAKFMTEVPNANAPKGEYVFLQYETSFANAPGKTETVTPMKDPDGVWRVSGYFIK